VARRRHCAVGAASGGARPRRILGSRRRQWRSRAAAKPLAKRALLARVDRVLDLSWLRAEAAGLYCESNGRPGVDPEVAVRLMLAGFLVGIIDDRRLMREAHVNIAIRRFVGYGLHEALPDRSSLTRIRQRWSAGRFRRIFRRTVKACMDAKVAKGEIVHVAAPPFRLFGATRRRSSRCAAALSIRNWVSVSLMDIF